MMKPIHKWIFAITTILGLGFVLFCLLLYLFFNSINGKILLLNMGNFKPPGSHYPPKSTGILFINFATDSDDSLDWGPYCSRLLYQKIRFMPDEILFIPTLDFIFQDLEQYNVPHARNTTLPYEAERYLAKAYGMDYLLRGTVIKRNDQIRFDGMIYQVETEQPVAILSQTAALSEPDKLISRLSMEIFNVLQIKLSEKKSNELAKTIVKNPDSFLTALEAFSLPDHQSEKSVELYKKAISLDSTFIYPYITIAGRMALYENPVKVRLFLQNAIQTFPDNPHLRIYDAVEEPVIHYMRYLHDYPDNLEALLYLAMDYSKDDYYHAPISIMEYTVKKYPNTWRVHNDLGHYYLKYAISIRDEKKVTQLNSRQLQKYNNILQNASFSLNRADQLAPNHPMVLNNLMYYTMESNAPENTILEYFSRSTTINPYLLQNWRMLFNVYKPDYLNQPDKLYSILSEAIKINPENHQFTDWFFESLDWIAQENRTKQSILLFQNDTVLLELADHVSYSKITSSGSIADDERLYSIGKALYRIDDYHRAWKYYDGIQYEPPYRAYNPHSYYLEKSIIANHNGQWDKMLDYADKCLNADACSRCGPHALRLKGAYYIRQKYFDTGFRFLQQAIDQNKQEVENYREYAYYSAQYNQNIDNGFHYIRKAIGLRPYQAEYYAILGQLYHLKGDTENALVNIDKAIGMEPDNNEFHHFKKQLIQSAS